MVKAAPSPKTPTKRWTPSHAQSFVLARTPVLSFDVFAALVGDTPHGSFEERVAKVRAGVRSLLDDDRRVREAIFIASPSLEARLPDWRSAPESENGQRVEGPLFRYVARMATRAMAFGSFVGNSFGRVGHITELSAGSAPYQRRTELDFWTLHLLATSLAADPVVRRASPCGLNSTTFVVGDEARFLVPVVRGEGEASRTDFEVGVVERDEYVDAILARAAAGSVAFAEFSATIERMGVAHNDAVEYVAALIDQGLVVPDVFPSPAGPDPVGAFIAKLAACEATRETAVTLAAARDALASIDRDGLGASPDTYRRALAPLERLPGISSLDKSFRVNLLDASSNVVVGADIVRDVVAAVEFLRRARPKRVGAERKRFVEAFERRYEGREVPLLEALDPDLGVGISEVRNNQPLLEGLPIGTRGEPQTEAFDAFSKTMLHKLVSATARGAEEIVLDDSDVPTTTTMAELPTLIETGIRIGLTGDAEAPPTIHLQYAGGPRAGVVASRFSFDPTVRERLVSAFAAEQAASDALLAELVHTPRSSAANALLSGSIRTYEIPCPEEGAVDRERTLPLGDLMVSVRGGQIQLRSKRLGKRVIPVLTTAHNTARAGFAPYEFLAGLQFQEPESFGVSFDWGPLAEAPFLPRVRYRNVVLHRARWSFLASEVRAIAAKKGGARFADVTALREVRRLPRFVVATDADLELITDLENPLSVDALVDLLSDKERPFVEEMLPAPDVLPRTKEGARFVNDVKLTLVREPATPVLAGADSTRATVGATADGARATIQRSFRPGSEWLFLKMYAGRDSVDEIVRHLLPRLAEECAGLYEKWFFLVYGDPDLHVRARFSGPAERVTKELWPRIATVLASAPWSLRIHRVMLDSYEREVERYGGARGVELAESVFHHDSIAVTRVFATEPSPDQLWRAALLGVSRLLDDLGYVGESKLAVAASARDVLRPEFAQADKLDHGLSKRFRSARAELAGLVASSPPPELDRIWKERSAAIGPVGVELRRLDERGELVGGLASVTRSLIHMSVLRLLPQANRAHEYALLDFVARLLTSELAQQRKGAAR